MSQILGFHDVLFPPDISYGCTGGPEYSTDVVGTKNGQAEYRNINWDESRFKAQAAHGVKNQAQLETLLAFFHARMGKAYGFRYKDWSDFKGISQYIGTGDGIKTQFQMVKNYVSGIYNKARTIRKPVEGTVKVYFDGVLQSTGWICNYDNGKITFSVPVPADVIVTADYEFHVPCRFDTDYMPISINNWSNYSWDNIPIIGIPINEEA